MPVQQPRKWFASGSNSPSTYAFHGSNSSHSKDSGPGGRTYHMPNYATSYANEKSNLITIHLEEAKGSKRGYVMFTLLVMFLVWFSVRHSPSKGIEYDLGSFSVPIAPSSTGGQEDVPYKESPASNDSSNDQKSEDTSKDTGKELDVYWGEATPAERCHAYGIREYSARLQRLPFFADWASACNSTPIAIHGQTFARPERCERRWPFGSVVGYWKVKSERDCSPQWGKFQEKESEAPPFPTSLS
ncbi:hypothetical protein NMY22_g7728 [Coprinellus aureogranulatus]|nr:hypothetical protein NMY22_g7728 [Coprinellus aureogranulatus]